MESFLSLQRVPLLRSKFQSFRSSFTSLTVSTDSCEIPESYNTDSNAMIKTLLVGSLAIFAGISNPSSVTASLFQSEEQDFIDEISSFRRPLYELLEQLTPNVQPNSIGVFSKTQILRGSQEDSNVVTNYLETYIKPLQIKMTKAVPALKLEGKEKERLLVLPSLMFGHILELKQAISDLSVTSQAREVSEVIDTLNEFLALSSTKYRVPEFKSSRPLSDNELFGPFGCEYWGKKRAEGSNACIPQE